jgi:hypothetical protein
MQAGITCKSFIHSDGLGLLSGHASRTKGSNFCPNLESPANNNLIAISYNKKKGVEKKN